MEDSPLLRQDARKNVEKVRAAALRSFETKGLDVPLEDIARSAGVSVGTIYNRFGSREALIDSVVPEMAAMRLDPVIAAAMALPTAWTRFSAYVRGISELLATDRLLIDIVSRRYPTASLISAVCDRTLEAGRDFALSAQRERSLRQDFTAEDLFTLLWTQAAAKRFGDAPGSWLRIVDFLLESLYTKNEVQG